MSNESPVDNSGATTAALTPPPADGNDPSIAEVTPELDIPAIVQQARDAVPRRREALANAKLDEYAATRRRRNAEAALKEAESLLKRLAPAPRGKNAPAAAKPAKKAASK